MEAWKNVLQISVFTVTVGHCFLFSFTGLHWLFTWGGGNRHVRSAHNKDVAVTKNMHFIACLYAQYLLEAVYVCSITYQASYMHKFRFLHFFSD